MFDSRSEGSVSCGGTHPGHLTVGASPPPAEGTDFEAESRWVRIHRYRFLRLYLLAFRNFLWLAGML